MPGRSRLCRGDATLSVVDIRGNKAVPQTVSESQDDELLSIVSIKGCGHRLSLWAVPCELH
jgi:hypothetical protein